ncbi:MAG: isoprenylcysteine carboxylmethyltransferase family protein [Byssovorax sp.]
MLIFQAMLGLVALLAVMGAALFGAAGTLDFWQARLYLGVFGGASLLVTLYLIRYDRKLLDRRIKAGAMAEPERAQKVIQALANLFFIGLLVVPGLDRRYGWSTVPPWISLAAAALVALGFFVVFLVFRENSYTSAVVELAQDQKVISTGPYRLVRHPMYAGAGILIAATPPALGSWAGLPCAAGLILVVILRLIEEEKFLSEKLDGYVAYREKVRYRLIPHVW